MMADRLREFFTHYWYVGIGVSFIWTAVSIVWTIRFERALARLRRAVKYLQSDDSPTAHKTTPTVEIRTGRPSRVPPPPTAPRSLPPGYVRTGTPEYDKWFEGQ